jgi:hypothetical protein
MFLNFNNAEKKSGKVHVPAALPPAKESPVSIEWKIRCAQNRCGNITVGAPAYVLGTVHSVQNVSGYLRWQRVLNVS